MKLIIDISKDKYDEIMSMDWNNCRRFFDEEIRAIHDGKVLDQEPYGYCISREAVMHILDEVGGDFDSPREAVVPIDYIADMVSELPSVTAQPEVGRWIYDKNIDNWKCSKCGETPKTMGYCGSVAFMAEHFKYCNHCGCKMQEVEE